MTKRRSSTPFFVCCNQTHLSSFAPFLCICVIDPEKEGVGVDLGGEKMSTPRKAEKNRFRPRGERRWG